MGWENVFHCEIEEWKRRFLESRFKCKSHSDVTTTDFIVYRGGIDILTGGFPCQDASIAKQDGQGQQGLQGKRTSLFYQMVRAIYEIRPKYVVAENVANILKTNRGADFRAILTELAGMGYNAEWRVCRASELGAPHHRARLYLVAYPCGIRQKPSESFFSNVFTKASQIPWKFAGTSIQTFRGGPWATEPPALCVDDGISGRLVRDRLHGFGNAIVPQIAYNIFKKISEL
jgi:DNA (cytosine-5)-methyltransferase 1